MMMFGLHRYVKCSVRDRWRFDESVRVMISFELICVAGFFEARDYPIAVLGNVRRIGYYFKYMRTYTTAVLCYVNKVFIVKTHVYDFRLVCIIRYTYIIIYVYILLRNAIIKFTPVPTKGVSGVLLRTRGNYFTL